MLRAGAMVYAIFLSLMLSMICTSYILMNYCHKVEVDDVIGRKQLIRHSKAVFNGYLAGMEQRKIMDIYFEDNPEHYEINSTLKSISWGVFDVLSIHSKWKQHSYKAVAMVGVNLNNDKRCLILSDRNKPLSLAGKTRIIGDCDLPKSGVKRAYVEGQNFTGNTLINGTIANSSNELPNLKEEMVQGILSRLKGESIDEDSIFNFDQVFQKSDTIINSYYHKTLFLTSNEAIELNNKVIKGNIIIHSTKQVRVDGSSDLEDVQIYSPIIVVNKGFEGKLQAFASDSIILNEDVHLSYPSVLSMIRNKAGDGRYEIIISQNSSVNGAVILNHYRKSRNSRGIIYLANHAVITGQVYTNDLLSHSGEIIGITYCNGFTLRTPSSIYENLLLNAVLDRSRLSSIHLGAALIGPYPTKSIVKWLI